MHPLKTTFAGLAALAIAVPALAQDNGGKPPPPYCENNPGFDDFDFWVGEWKVYSNDEDRTYAGHNSITKIAKDCLIYEHWTGANGVQGYSMNYYNPVRDEWRQVWVSNGYAIDYTGGLNENGEMVLEGEIDYYRPDRSFPFRGIWTPQDDGTVVQHFDQYNPDTEEWTVWFEGLYVPDESEE